MRKMMQREVTYTTAQLVRMKMVDGEVTAEVLEPVTLIGNLSVEQAQREINKRSEFKENPAQVVGVEANTQLYELPLDVFLEHATVKERPATKEEVAEVQA